MLNKIYNIETDLMLSITLSCEGYYFTLFINRSNHLGSGSILRCFVFSCSLLTKVKVYDLTSGGRLVFTTMTRVTTDLDGDKRQRSTFSGPPIEMSHMWCMNCLDSLFAWRIE